MISRIIFTSSNFIKRFPKSLQICFGNLQYKLKDMKTTTNLTKSVTILTLALAVTAAAQKTKTNTNQLPQTTQKFIKSNFSNSPISYAEKETKMGFLSEYKAYLENGTEMEFTGKGDWKEIENKQSGLPFSVAPKKIQTYIKKKFPRTYLVKIEKERQGYSTKISNGLELEFDGQGNFIRIDD